MSIPFYLNIKIMIDKNLTIKMQSFLEKEDYSNEDLVDGATMLLKLNKNQAMFNTIIRHPERYVKKIRYELQKRLPMRLDEMTKQDVVALEKEIMPPVEQAVNAENEEFEDDDEKAVATGKRSDHDQLPPDIQNLWNQNVERWKKIKQLYNSCKETKLACDRYEYLKILKEEWVAYKDDFNKYDSYKIKDALTSENSCMTTDEESSVKDVTNARAYISKNLEKLETIDKNSSKYVELLNKVRNRVNVVIKAGESFSPEMEGRLCVFYKDLFSDEKDINDTQTVGK